MISIQISKQNITLRNMATHQMPTEMLAPFIQTCKCAAHICNAKPIEDKPKGKLKSKHQTEQINPKKYLAREFSPQVRVTKTIGKGTNKGIYSAKLFSALYFRLAFHVRFFFFRQSGSRFAYLVVILLPNGYLQAACWSPEFPFLALKLPRFRLQGSALWPRSQWGDWA